MAVPLLPIVAPVAGQLIDTIIQGAQSKANIRNQKRANMELMKYAYSKDLEMWNTANLYNSPAEQMKRLQAGGLNPNLVYGHGNAITPAQQIPKYQAIRTDYNALPPVQFGGAISSGLDAFYDFRIKNAQADLLKEQLRQTSAKATYQELLNWFSPFILSGKKSEARYKSQLYGGNLEELEKNQLELLMLRNYKARQEIELLKKKGILSDLDIDWYQYKKLLPAFMGLGAGLLFRRSGNVPRLKSVLNRKFNPGQTPAMKNYKPVW